MKIYATLSKDIDQGHVWIKREEFPPRTLVKIKNIENGEYIYCEALQIDEYFMNSYNQPPRIFIDDPTSAIVINEWYRKKLGLRTQTNCSLKIKKSTNPISKLSSTFQHPQIIVRIGATLGCISIFLGLLSLFITIISTWF